MYEQITRFEIKHKYKLQQFIIFYNLLNIFLLPSYYNQIYNFTQFYAKMIGAKNKIGVYINTYAHNKQNIIILFFFEI